MAGTHSCKASLLAKTLMVSYSASSTDLLPAAVRRLPVLKFSGTIRV